MDVENTLLNIATRLNQLEQAAAAITATPPTQTAQTVPVRSVDSVTAPPIAPVVDTEIQYALNWLERKLGQWIIGLCATAGFTTGALTAGQSHTQVMTILGTGLGINALHGAVNLILAFLRNTSQNG